MAPPVRALSWALSSPAVRVRPTAPGQPQLAGRRRARGTRARGLGLPHRAFRVEGGAMGLRLLPIHGLSWVAVTHARGRIQPPPVVSFAFLLSLCICIVSVAQSGDTPTVSWPQSIRLQKHILVTAVSRAKSAHRAFLFASRYLSPSRRRWVIRNQPPPPALPAGSSSPGTLASMGFLGHPPSTSSARSPAHSPARSLIQEVSTSLLTVSLSRPSPPPNTMPPTTAAAAASATTSGAKKPGATPDLRSTPPTPTPCRRNKRDAAHHHVLGAETHKVGHTVR